MKKQIISSEQKAHCFFLYMLQYFCEERSEGMKLEITPQAVEWFEKELLLSSGDSIRIFGKYGGATNVHVGFSTGIEVTTPNESLIEKKENGITFFTEVGDEWFFAEYTLEISLDEKLKEPAYFYR